MKAREGADGSAKGRGGRSAPFAATKQHTKLLHATALATHLLRSQLVKPLEDACTANVLPVLVKPEWVGTDAHKSEGTLSH